MLRNQQLLVVRQDGIDIAQSRVLIQGPPVVLARLSSQETLAEMVGTTRSRVSFFMNKFRKLGFIEYNGSLEVNNSLLNVVLHDNPHLRKRAEKEE